MSKAGSVLLNCIKGAAARAKRLGAIEIRSDFLWPHALTQVVVRGPGENGFVRDIELIPLEEIAEACYLCVQKAFGIQRSELVTQVARLLGYDRTGPRVRERVEKAIELCRRQGRIEMQNDRISLLHG
jgi:hypothetical protein